MRQKEAAEDSEVGDKVPKRVFLISRHILLQWTIRYVWRSRERGYTTRIKISTARYRRLCSISYHVYWPEDLDKSVDLASVKYWMNILL